jgi:hypothetical protein
MEHWIAVTQAEYADHLQRRINRLSAEKAVLLQALQALYDENMDYIRINKLSGAENNQVLRNARAALLKARGE